MRTISTFTLGLILVATGLAFGQEPAKKSATTTKLAPADVPVIKDGWVFSVWVDGNVEKDGMPIAKELQSRVRTWARDKVSEVNASNPEIEIGLDEYDINDTDRKGHLLSPKEAFDQLPGRDIWIARLKNGDAVVTRERVKNGRVLFRSFPVCLGGPMEPGDVMNGLLKQPLRSAQPVAHPGDVLVLWHAGEKKQAVQDCQTIATASQLKFEEHDVNTPDGLAKFNRRMAKFTPAARLKMIQEADAMYLQRGWLLEDDTLSFGQPQELSVAVPATDVAALYVSKTTDPIGGRKSPVK